MAHTALNCVFHYLAKDLPRFFRDLLAVTYPQQRAALHTEVHSVEIVHLAFLPVPVEVPIAATFRVAILHTNSQLEKPLQPVKVHVRFAEHKSILE